MPCPKCGGINLVSAGSYKIKRTTFPSQRLKCKDCGAYFVLRNSMFRKKIPMKVTKRILELWKTKKPFGNRFGNKRTYSTREIARIMNVSKTYVWKIVSGK